MKKVIAMLLFAAAAAFTLTACDDDNDRRGVDTLRGTTWVAESAILGDKTTWTLTFPSDTTFEVEMKDDDGQVYDSFSGTYMYDSSNSTVMMSVDGDTMTGKVNGNKLSVNDEGDITVFTKK